VSDTGQIEHAAGMAQAYCPGPIPSFDPFVQAIFDVVPETIILVDRYGKVLALNKAAAQRLGRPADQLIGLGPQEAADLKIRTRRQIQAAIAKISQAASTGRPQKSKDRRGSLVFETTYQPIPAGRGPSDLVLVFSRQVGRAPHKSSHDGPLSTLTPVQLAILRLIVKGMSNKEIAHQLHRSRRTIENHRARIMQRLHAEGLPHLIRIAVKLGL